MPKGVIIASPPIHVYHASSICQSSLLENSKICQFDAPSGVSMPVQLASSMPKGVMPVQFASSMPKGVMPVQLASSMPKGVMPIQFAS